MYDDVVSEEVPEDFLSFLEEADERAAESDLLKKKADGAETIEAAPVGARAMKTET